MSSFASTVLSWCTTCGAESAFEQPDCPDDHGHGVDCPEWACQVCGEAVVVGFGLTERAAHDAMTSHVA